MPAQISSEVDARSSVRELFEAAVDAVKPGRLIPRAISLNGAELLVMGTSVMLPPAGRIFVVGAGKASALMAQALEQVLGERITGGLVVVKYGHSVPCARIEVAEAGHPFPDEAGIEATKKIVRICINAAQDDIVICLLSGGGSALLADCPSGLTLPEWTAFSRLLVNSGASIVEINAVRKHLSAVKGGQLARITCPARLICLALSDVVGDPADVIASGPGVADPTTFGQALDVLKRYELEESTPKPVLNYLRAGLAGKIPETPKPGDPALAQALNALIGNNRVALEAALKLATEQGFKGEIVTDSLQGDTAEAAAFIVETARSRKAGPGRATPRCLLFGGETTLRVAGNGLGGRNQHLALQAAKLIRSEHGITVLAAGTDGTDGPTIAAGAIVDGNTWDAALLSGADPQSYLDAFDSFHFFEKAGGHVVSGPTMTNVMDVVIVLVH